MNSNEPADKLSTIKVIIEKSQDAKPFNKEECFFKDELDQLKKWIESIIKNNKDIINNKDDGRISRTDGDKSYFYKQNTIAVLGPRGVGKTSFLLSLESIIKNEEKLSKKIIWLPTIDPTRIEENETFPIVVVANILKEIKRFYKGDFSQNIRDRLESLSRDFVILAPSKVHLGQWKDLLGDPNSFAYELLSHAHSGLTLANSFNDFLRVCLKEREAEVFIQPIDDVDNTVSQGWPVLETLRRYMVSPYLINILSGDIRLYQSLVRKQQVDKFKSLIKIRRKVENDAKILLQTSELVDQIFQITDQYLAKVMPSHLRIYLTPLSVKIIAAEKNKEFLNLEYDVSDAGSAEESLLVKSFSEVYANFSYDLLNIPKPSDFLDALKKRSWLPFPLLPLTTRSMIRFLKVIQPWVYDSKSNKNGKNEEKNKEAEEDKIIKAKKNKPIESLVHIFNSSLYNSNIQTGNLLSIKSYKDITWLAEYCLDIEQKLPSFWTLETRYGDEEINHRALLLQAFLLQAWKDRSTNGSLLYPDGPWSYVVKVCFPCWIVDTFRPKEDDLRLLKEFLNVSIVKRHTYLAGEGLSYALKFTSEIIEKKIAKEKKDIAQEKRTAQEEREQKGERSTDIPVHYIGIAELSPHNVIFEELDKLSEKGRDCIKEAYFILNWFMFEMGSGLWLSILIGLARLTDVLREGPSKEDQLKIFLSLLTESGMLQILDPNSDSKGVPTDGYSYKKQYELSKDSRLISYLLSWIKQIKQKNIISDENMVSPLVISRTFLSFQKILIILDGVQLRIVILLNLVLGK